VSEGQIAYEEAMKRALFGFFTAMILSTMATSALAQSRGTDNPECLGSSCGSPQEEAPASPPPPPQTAWESFLAALASMFSAGA
jgi:hypothetical protein